MRDKEICMTIAFYDGMGQALVEMMINCQNKVNMYAQAKSRGRRLPCEPEVLGPELDLEFTPLQRWTL